MLSNEKITRVFCLAVQLAPTGEGSQSGCKVDTIPRTNSGTLCIVFRAW